MHGYELVLCSLKSQGEGFAEKIALLGENSKKHILSPAVVLASGEYPCDVATTLVIWVNEAIAAGAIKDSGDRPPWWNEVQTFDDVQSLRMETPSDQGLRMLGEAYDYLERCLDAGTNDQISWEMSFKGGVGLDEFMTGVDHHGMDHLTKVDLALSLQKVGGPYWEDL